MRQLNEIGMVRHRDCDTGVIFRKKGVPSTDPFEIELVDQGSQNSNWCVKDGKIILQCTHQGDVTRLLRELGFNNPSENLFSHANGEMPLIQLVGNITTPTNWHIGIHFDEAVPLCADFRKNYPHTARRANSAISKARRRQVCCYQGEPLDGLSIEVTVGDRFHQH